MLHYGNIGNYELVVRYLFGGTLLIGILLLMLPPATAFVATYAVITAIIAWDPVYALLSWVRDLIPRSVDAKALVHGA